jgi:hypothetical protein
VRTHGRDVCGTQDEGQAQAEQDGVEALEEHEGERDGGQRRAVHVFDLRTALEREQVRELRLQIGREDLLVRLDGAHGGARGVVRVRVWVQVWVWVCVVVDSAASAVADVDSLRGCFPVRVGEWRTETEGEPRGLGLEYGGRTSL